MMGDLLPLVIANLTQQKILIFSSKINIIEVLPSLKMEPLIKKKEQINNRLILVHIAIEGEEHYDTAGE